MLFVSMRTMTPLVVLMAVHTATAWLTTTGNGIRSGSLLGSRRITSSPFSLFHSPSDHDNDEIPVASIRRRGSIEGVSLAPTGFWVMLRIGQDEYLPWQVTNDPQDAHAATSAEALTMIQLLSGVDMAGAILPPDVLAKLVIYHCESVVQRYKNTGLFFAKQVTVAKDILDYVQESLPNATVAFSEAHEWTQSRVQLPEASLDEVLVSTTTSGSGGTAPFALQCTLRDFGSLTFTPSLSALESVLYQFSPQTSLAFTALALALRYQAPITVETNTHSDESITLDALKQQFPMYAAASTLQQSSNRVQQNIVRGFEIHKLSGALKIALEKGDHAAAAKIRQALDDYDSMEELPTAEIQEDGLVVEELEPMGSGGFYNPQQNMTMSVLQ